MICHFDHLDYDSSSSAHPSTKQVLEAMAIGLAFMHRELDPSIYVKQSQNFVGDHPSYVYIMRKALYGLKQTLKAL